MHHFFCCRCCFAFDKIQQFIDKKYKTKLLNFSEHLFNKSGLRTNVDKGKYLKVKKICIVSEGNALCTLVITYSKNMYK